MAVRQEAQTPNHKRLTGREWDVLAQAARDVGEIGRMRTSTELYGRDTRARDNMLRALRLCESLGLVERHEHDWSSGHVTPSGAVYLLRNPRHRLDQTLW